MSLLRWDFPSSVCVLFSVYVYLHVCTHIYICCHIYMHLIQVWFYEFLFYWIIVQYVYIHINAQFFLIWLSEPLSAASGVILTCSYHLGGYLLSLAQQWCTFYFASALVKAMFSTIPGSFSWYMHLEADLSTKSPFSVICHGFFLLFWHLPFEFSNGAFCLIPCQVCC